MQIQIREADSHEYEAFHNICDNDQPHPLDTLTYRGLGIEGLTSSDMSHEEQCQVISMARHRIASEKRINTGVLIPFDEEEVFSLEVLKLGEIHGEYCWWVKPVGKV